MSETVTEKEVCSKCGAEVREGTAFCFACGGRVEPDEPSEQVNGGATAVDAKSQAALDDLAKKLSGDDKTAEQEDKLAKAADERKKARVSQRKTREFVWEPHNDTPVTFIIAAAVIGILAVLAVLFTAVWK